MGGVSKTGTSPCSGDVAGGSSDTSIRFECWLSPPALVWRVELSPPALSVGGTRVPGREWGCVWGDACCCIAERGSKAHGSKYLPRTNTRAGKRMVRRGSTCRRSPRPSWEGTNTRAVAVTRGCRTPVRAWLQSNKMSKNLQHPHRRNSVRKSVAPTMDGC